MATGVNAAERLLDLVIALAHTPHRMTKADVRTQVNGYADAVSDEAFERMFERDKVALRELGIPLVTLTDSAHGDDIGYRIDLDGYELPPLTWTAAEVGVLALAAEVWQEARLGSRARRALTKLRAVAPTTSTELAGHVLRLQAPETTFEALLEAIAARRVVAFGYRTAGTGQRGRREVEPWRLLVRDGGWYLHGWDTDREAPRLFRLSRITGAVQVLTAQAEHPAQDAPARLGGSDAAQLSTAVLAVRAERAAALRLRSRPARPATPAPDGYDVVEVDVTDTEELAREIAGYTDAVVVLGPPELREAVLRRLRAAAALGGHHG